MAWEKLVTFVTEVQNDTKKLQRNNEKVQETCNEFLEQLDGELTTSKEHKAVERIDKQLKEIKKDLERVLGKASDKVVIEFVGATCSGKSTLINALLKEERLPVGFVQTTMCLIEICTTDKEDWSVTVNETMPLSNTKDRNEIKKLLDAMRHEDEEEREKLGIDSCSKVRVDWPKKFSSKDLPENVVLVDTPGLGMTDKCNQVVRDSCKKADIIVAVINSKEPFIQCATELVKEVNCQYTFGVFTKWDKLITKVEKQKSAISVDNVRKKYTEQYLEGVNSKEQRSTDDDIFFVDSLHVSGNNGEEDSSLGVTEFQQFEKKLAEISKTVKGQLLKREVKAVTEKAEDVYVNLKEIVEKRKREELTHLQETLDSLEGGDKNLTTICQNFERSIDNVIKDIYIDDIIKQFEKDIATGNFSEKDAFKKLRGTVSEKIKEIICSKTTSVNNELKNWKDDMKKFFPFSQTELPTTESEIPKLESKELPNDLYSKWLDWHFYCTNNYLMTAVATGTFGASLGPRLVIAAGAAVAGAGGGVSGLFLAGATKTLFGFGIGDTIKKFAPISRSKMAGWKRYLAKECTKLGEDSKNLMKKEIDRIKKEKSCEVNRAIFETHKKRNELDMESHHLNKWSKDLDSRRKEVQDIRRKIDQLF